MAQKFETAYVSCGCNRVPHAADWGKNGLICYASCNSVVIYDPTFAGEGGKVIHTLYGHKERVNCVRWLRNSLQTPENCFVSASADGSAIVWSWFEENKTFMQKALLKGHSNIVNIADGFIKKTWNSTHFPQITSFTIATSSIDSTVMVWEASNIEEIKCVDIIKWDSGFCLDVKLDIFPNTDVMLLACAADDNKVHLFTEYKKSEIDKVNPDHRFYKIHVLSGHDDWVRSMDFLPHGNDLYLATGSQDTFIRIYKFERKEVQIHSVSLNSDQNLNDLLQLDKKIIKVGSTHNEHYFFITLETILAGHEGWIYGVSWIATSTASSNESFIAQTTEISGIKVPDKIKLLSSSMDKTMIIWSPNSGGIWSGEATVGEVGGNMLGFYGGKFGPNGKRIMAHGYQGSFHIWCVDKDNTTWEPKVVVGGHTSEVTDFAWDTKGNYILSVGNDQTTRLHAPWIRDNGETVTWHEIARPQIHGYDLSCIATISENKFASGAEEKIIRAFTAPNNFIENFKRICYIKTENSETEVVLPQGASVPALGLSNKPVFEQMKKEGYLVDDEYPDLYFSPIILKKPPTEENLMQNTLWPEAQKLYGHGYEIYSLTARNDGVLLASACKATSPEHAAIILWNAKTWLQIQKLFSHQLTVTQMSFSPNGKYLLSVSRDRKWSLFKVKDDGKLYELIATSDTKNNLHTRVIWCCSWTHDSMNFATGSRDGKIGFWTPVDNNSEGPQIIDKCSVTLDLSKESVTALAFAPIMCKDFYVIAIGLENGKILIYRYLKTVVESINVFLQGEAGHDLAVKRLAFRPKTGKTGFSQDTKPDESNVIQLASCGCDHIVKIYNLFWDNF